MSKAVICDGCGDIYNNYEELKTVIMVDKSTRNDPNNTIRYDLCPVCTYKLEQWMHGLLLQEKGDSDA